MPRESNSIQWKAGTGSWGRDGTGQEHTQVLCGGLETVYAMARAGTAVHRHSIKITSCTLKTTDAMARELLPVTPQSHIAAVESHSTQHTRHEPRGSGTRTPTATPPPHPVNTSQGQEDPSVPPTPGF